jgi:hypothetical protein
VIKQILKRETQKNFGSSVNIPLYYREVEIWIDAPLNLVYELISNITNIGSWSPECYKNEWTRGSTAPVAGAYFRGYNKWKNFQWSREVRIEAAEQGQEFAFRTLPTFFYRDSTLWRYILKPQNGGTHVTESFALTEASFLIRLLEDKTSRQDDTQKNMQKTLERLKAHAEAIARTR